ncbi:aldose epimerase family protein [Spiroplasma culicicola]|uniref:Aldose 1-epimerase family protein n=1 Tax=Spiroplasma culicicola AES-1 TaxID=1276246 RepID=W6A6L6_9MOLU|nr:hypothetical protein [Spiroplasma culicicola]AHI52642.1 aldose 1-epimerase family protein [Spiroplasma culicicola AES-1]
MYKIENKKLKVEFTIDEIGFEIKSIKYNNQEVVYQEEGSWKKRWPTLFPVCGSIIDGIVHEGKKYDVPRHGFFKEIKEWIVEVKGELATLTFNSNQMFKDIFPFEFKLQLDLILEEDTFNFKTSVTNLSDEVMYYSFGHHPAFLTDSNTKIVFENEENYSMKMGPHGTYLKTDELYKAKEITVAEVDFSDSKSLFFDEIKSNWIKYNYKNVEITFDIEQYPYFILWSTNNTSNYICIEPWQGLPDEYERQDLEFKNKKGNVSLRPNQTNVFDLKMNFKNI